jgi:hypothetical protein
VTFEVKKGAAFLAPSGPGELLHLFVVLTNACPDGLHLIATIGRVKPNIKHDATCEIAAGEHGFIDKPSFVRYGMLTQMAGVHIRKMIDKKYYVEKEPVAEELCERICAGVATSDFTANGMRRYFEKNGSD